MPEEEKKTVDIDTSGPETEVDIPEEKDEAVVDTTPKEETTSTEQETTTEETVEEKKEDSKLEEYSKGVQSRIAKLTRKMREAERREAAAVQYASALENKRKLDNERFQKIDSDYTKRFEENVKSGMESAQKELAMAIEAGDAQAQVTANKRIATLALENARLEQQKTTTPDEVPVRASQGGDIDRPIPRRAEPDIPPDPKAEAWAAKNSWFGSDKAMTYTAFEIHKDLVNEGFDPKSDDYYNEVDKRIRVDFKHKFDSNAVEHTSKPVQSVASAQRSVKPGRKTVRLTPSQVAIAKKLGVPLEEYAKQIKLTEGA